MKIISGKDLINTQPIAATIGFFDGFHLGHRYLVEQVKAVALSRNIPSAIITFNNHPRKVVRPDYIPELLTSRDERLTLIEHSGIDFCILLDFDEKLANLSALEFLDQILKQRLSVDALVIGYDHRFGKDRANSYDDYVCYGNQIGIFTSKADALQLEGINVSSSIIRSMILAGEIEKANLLLDYSYTLVGEVVEGQKLGRTIGFPTANIKPECSEKIIPANGVYVVQVKVADDLIYGMLNIGVRPTIGNDLERTIEVHLLNFDGDIYGQKIAVEFLHKLREERKMSGLDELRSQLDADRADSLQYLTKKG